MQDRQELLDEKDRREGLKSLFYFGKFVLGYDLEVDPHKEICDFVQDVEGNPKELLLLPRGIFKTTIVSQIYPVWLAVKDPNVRILLDSEVLKNSERNLRVVKETLAYNQRLRDLYGVLANAGDGNLNELTIRTRTNRKLKEPTFGTSSVDTVDVGPHWDFIICDDLHSEHNSKTKAQIDNVYEHWRLLFSLLDPKKFMRMVGTRWADLDVYGRIKEEHPSFTVMERKAEQNEKLENAPGNCYFPQRFPHEVLMEIKAEQGIDMYAAQYLNDPLPQGESQSFKRTYFRYGEHRDCPLYLAVDPAIGESRDSDNTSLVLGGLSASNDLFIDNYTFGRFNPFQTIELVFGYIDKLGPRLRAVGFETNAFQKMLKFAFDVEMRKRGKFIKVIELRHSKSKSERILSLQPRYAAGAVYHKLWMKGGQLEEELLRFPRGRRDDVADAEASILEMVSPHSKGYAASQSKRIKAEKDRDFMKNLQRNQFRSLDDRIKYHQELNRRSKQTARYVHPQLGDMI